MEVAFVVGRIMLPVMICAVLPAAAAGQEAATFAEVQHLLRPKQQVVVTDVTGEKTRGDVLSVDASSISVRLRDEYGLARTRRFEPDRIATIRRSDRLWNGILFGVGAGFVAVELWRNHVCGPREPNDECSIIVQGAGLVLFVPSGAVAGALIDKFVGNTIVYRGPGAGIALRIAPQVTPSRAAIQASLTF
jgi:hypothetical protein